MNKKPPIVSVSRRHKYRQRTTGINITLYNIHQSRQLTSCKKYSKPTIFTYTLKHPHAAWNVKKNKSSFRVF